MINTSIKRWTEEEPARETKKDWPERQKENQVKVEFKKGKSFQKWQ